MPWTPMASPPSTRYPVTRPNGSASCRRGTRSGNAPTSASSVSSTGIPPDARAPLWLRDDDFRLSFTYGSYVTLTNLGPRGLQRLVDQRISPLYVSVHATNPDVRIRLLKNDRAGLILEQLRGLLDGGLEVHTQVVLCPDWNDGEELDRTIRELYALGKGVLTLSVVPVGLTRYNLGRPVRLLLPAEAATAVRQTGAVRDQAMRERGHSWCYAADELFLIAGRDVPAAGYYDDWALLENGVGALRTLLDSFHEGKDRLAPVDGVDRVRIVTGTSMRPWFEELGPLRLPQNELRCGGRRRPKPVLRAVRDDRRPALRRGHTGCGPGLSKRRPRAASGRGPQRRQRVHRRPGSFRHGAAVVAGGGPSWS